MAKMIPSTISIETKILPEAWAKLVRTVMRDGIVLDTEYGPKSKDICSLTTITHPFEEPMLHPQFPTREQHLREYVKQFTREYDWKKQGFKYTYMDRLVNYPINKQKETFEDYDWITTDQLFYIKCELQKSITRRAQAITWVPELDMGDPEPCCLQRVWLRKLSPTTVEMHCEWRSRDIYNAWLSNYIGILSMIKREILDPLELKLVKLVDFIDAAHIYEADWNDAIKVDLFHVNPTLR